MADVTEVAEVRKNTDEPDEDPYGDLYIDGLIDALGVAGASATLWRKKAASYAKMVNVQEAGSSHAFSDLLKNALQMVDVWQSSSDAEAEIAGASGRAVVKVIIRDDDI